MTKQMWNNIFQMPLIHKRFERYAQSKTFMANSKTTLPNASANFYLTDGGLETTLVFLEGYELPCFAALIYWKMKKAIMQLGNIIGGIWILQ